MHITTYESPAPGRAGRPTRPARRIWAAAAWCLLAALTLNIAETRPRGLSDGPECDDDDVIQVADVIDGDPFFALVPHPAGPNGTGILITSHIPDPENPRKRPEALEQDVFDKLLARAKTYRQQKLALRRQVGWARPVYFILTDHYDLGWDIDSMQMHGSRSRPSIAEAIVTYAKRLEQMWNDFEDVVGPIGSDIGHPMRIFVHDRAEEAVRTSQVLANRTVRAATHFRGDPMCIWWKRDTITQDTDMWETVTHIAGGYLGARWRGLGKHANHMIPGWLDEGIAFYLTRLHREMDSHTTTLFQEQSLEKPVQIDGKTWKRYAASQSRRMKDEDLISIFTEAVSQLTMDDRIIGWAIVRMMIEYSYERSAAIFDSYDVEDEDGIVTKEEWFANPMRWDTDGDLQMDEKEKYQAETVFREWDRDRDGVITKETEAVANIFREFLDLQKGADALDHEDALQKAFGWTNYDLIRRFRMWLAGRPFEADEDQDFAAMEWRDYKDAVEEYLRETMDEVKMARAVAALTRWQTDDGVQLLYELLELLEKRVERGEIPRPLTIYRAAQMVVSNYSEGEALETLIGIVVDGRGKRRAENVTVRNTLLRGLAENRVRDEVNEALARALKADEWSIRVGALDTLKARGVPLGANDVADAVTRTLADPVQAVRIAACQCLVRLANRPDGRQFVRILQALADRLLKEEGTVREDLVKALREITGVQLGFTYRGWARWIGRYQSAVQRGEAEPRIPDPTVDGSDEDQDEYAEDDDDTPTYFGDKIYSERIVFLIDRSYSMVEPLRNKAGLKEKRERERRRPARTGGEEEEEDETEETEEDLIDWSKVNNKWDLAREMMIATLKQMSPKKHQFTIILFDHRIWVWKDRLVSATPANVEDAIKWLSNQPNPNSPSNDKWGLTNIYDAIEMALDMSTAESIFTNRGKGRPATTGETEDDDEVSERDVEEMRFLTDGEPTDGKYTNREDLLAHIRELNRSRKVKINTYGLGQHDGSLCSAIAEQNNGVYKNWSYDSGR
jgi:hypothetical protein